VISVSFRPVLEDDLPLLAEWLGREHVEEWWKEPWALDAVRENYMPMILGRDPTHGFVIVYEGRDIGLIQSYRLSDHPQWAVTIAGTGLTFPSAIGIDYLIGERDLVGRGIGSAAIDAFTGLLFTQHPDVTCIVVTPQLANMASCRALEKAGYERKWTGMLDSDDPADAGVAALYMKHRD
jgi:aminoglycoside 6'-N-acetyltransferase